MANHTEFNKVVKKLVGRKFWCKEFYDISWIKVKLDIGKNEVYLKEEVDDIIEELRVVYENQQDEVVRQKRKASDLSLENYQLKKDKKYKGEEEKIEEDGDGNKDY